MFISFQRGGTTVRAGAAAGSGEVAEPAIAQPGQSRSFQEQALQQGQERAQELPHRLTQGRHPRSVLYVVFIYVVRY